MYIPRKYCLCITDQKTSKQVLNKLGDFNWRGKSKIVIYWKIIIENIFADVIIVLTLITDILASIRYHF